MTPALRYARMSFKTRLSPTLAGDSRHQGVVVDPIEERIEVYVHDPVASFFDEAPGGIDRHVGRTLGPKPEAHRREVRVENGGEHL